MKIKSYDRRELFKILGGSALLLHPLLSSREGFAADNDKRRFLVFLTSSGVRQDAFWPSGDSNNYSFSGRALEPLKDFQKELVILKGIRNHRGNTKDAHSMGAVSLLTGQEANLEGCIGNCDFANGTQFARSGSIDQLYGDYLANKTSRHSLVLSLYPTAHRQSKYISYDRNGNYIPVITNPYDVFNTLFKDLTASCEASKSGKLTPVQLKEKRRSILDAIKSDLDRAQKKAGLGASEKVKLDEYLSGIRDIEKSMDNMAVASSVTCELVKPLTLTPRVDINNKDNYAKVAKMMMDLIVASFELDITRSVTLSWSVGGADGVSSSFANFKGQPIAESYHKLSHFKDGDAAEKSKILDKWHASQFAYLIGKMKSVKEGDQNLLHNSIAMWTSELGDGYSHSGSNIPMVIAGTAGGRFATGRFEQHQETHHEGLLLDFMQALGMPGNKIGRSNEQSKRILRVK